MFERFTDRARRVVVLAQDEAKTLGHDHIGTEHLLLGLTNEPDGVAGRVLATLGIDEAVVRSRIEQAIGRGHAAPRGHIPFTPRAKKVLELSLREALAMGHNYIGTEHILLGLLREEEGLAAEVLRELGADLERVRRAVVDVVAGVTATGTAGAEGVFVEYETSQEIDEPDATPSRVVDSPTCPACRASLTRWLRVRAIDANGEDETTVPVRIAYCGRCGAALQALP